MEESPIRRSGRRLGAALEARPVIFIMALSFLLTFVIESLSRHSLLKGVVFTVTHPLCFAVNMAIILATLSVSLFFRKRIFFLTLFSLTWLGLGIANAVILSFRVTPFGLIDIQLLTSVADIITVYMDPWQIVLLIVGIVAVLTGLVFLFIRSPKTEALYLKAAIFFAASAALAAGLYGLTVLGHEDDRRESFANISDAYEHYGFVYCFCTGAVDRGVDEPDFYSRFAVRSLMSGLQKTPSAETLPNIVMVQLESFFDVAYLDDVILDENPIPTFTALRSECSSGFLQVPSIGAGTANTEFEVLSGMSMAFFGMGEYPYKTILQEEACETIATDLKAHGYTANAIHNNAGTFYKRNEVFAQLGFDTFTSIEYMKDVTYNPIGWAKDSILTKEILKALDSTPGRNFVFTITVQGHGKYQRGVDSDEAESLDIIWENHEEEDEDSKSLAYYLSQLQETDEFIGDLVRALERRTEPTVLVLYGDHLPNFDIGTEELKKGDLFDTEYVIWSNMDLPVEHKDLAAYQLSAEVMKKVGLSGGILSKYHQQKSGSAGYEDGLSLLEYDMLYGKFYCYGGKNPYERSDLRMGVEPITLSDAEWADGILTVQGHHFTDWSCIAIDGEALDTETVSSNMLCSEMDEPPETDAVLTVQQVTASSVVLSESVGIRWRP